MPTRPARTADEITDSIRSLIDRVADAKVTHELARRSQDIAEVLAERSADVGQIANEAWKDTKPMRRDAAKRFSRASADATKWADRTWRKTLRPALRDVWKGRTVALGAAGAAVPAGREIVDTAAVRLGLKRREERHWGAFFLGLFVGAALGAIAALLTTPKRGSEMRQELGTRAEELATRAKDDWVPIFQREGTNGSGDTLPGETLPGERLTGGGYEPSTASVQEGAAAAGTGAATGEAAEQAADDAAEAINDAYEVDREAT